MRALVIGSSGGIGSAIAGELRGRSAEVKGISRSQDGLDVTDEASVRRVFAGLDGSFELIFVAIGALTCTIERPEKSLREVSAEELAAQHLTNAIGPMLVLKHALPLLPRDRRSVFAVLSARVGSIGDNRLGGWYSYRASKAALNQLLHGAAIEIARTHNKAIVAALHPGTVATPFTENFAASHDRAPPEDAARQLLDVIKGLEPAQTGGFFDYAGKVIPW